MRAWAVRFACLVKLPNPKAADATAKAAMAERLIFEMAEGLACFLVLVWGSPAGVSRGAVEPVEPVASRVAGLSAGLVVLELVGFVVLVVLVVLELVEPVVPLEARLTRCSELCLGSLGLPANRLFVAATAR